MSSILFQILLFHTLWLLAGLWVVRWRVRSQWDPAWESAALGPRRVAALSFVYHAVPLAAVIAIVATTGATDYHPRGGYYALVVSEAVLVLPFILSRWILARRAAGLERRLAGDPDASHLALLMRIQMNRVSVLATAIFLVVWQAFSPWTLQGSGVSTMVGILLVNHALYGTRWVPVGKLPPLLKLPELPLWEEIRNLFPKHEGTERPVSVQPGRRTADPFKLPVMYSGKWDWSRWGRNSVIPLGMLLHLEPPTYTAALSRDIVLGRTGGYEVPRYLYPAAMFGCMTLPVALFVFVLIVPFMPMSRLMTAAVALILFVAIMGVLGLLVVRIDLQGTGRENYRNAFLNWHDADPEADRTVEEFVAALAQTESVIECISDPEVTLYRLRQDRALMAFLDLCGPEVKESAMLAARHALTQPAPTEAETLTA